MNPTPDNDPNAPQDENTPLSTPRPGEKRHIIKPAWLRRTLKTLLGLLIFVLLIPVLLYLPPVQDLVVKIAEDVVHKSTGMTIGIGKFRLSFPLDVHLKDIYVLEASADTMVRADEVVADVKLLPLFALDIKLNQLSLLRGYYRMVSPDSSMILTVNAGKLVVDDRSSFNLKNSELNLNRTQLSDGGLTLYMDVWKKKQTPDTATTASSPFKIIANEVDLRNFSFGMSMLPTIDTLDLKARNVLVCKAVVDLGENLVKWDLASISGGGVKYLTPTPEYVRTHPAPPSQPSTGPPMRIMGDSIALDSLSALYAVKDARPLPGFDASYIQVDGIAIGLRNFYNESSTVRLPITRLRASERCGLRIVKGEGTIGVDSTGLTLKGMDISTPYSHIKAAAGIPFALMALEPTAPLNAFASGRVGLPDVEAFMPSLKQFTSMVPARKPLDFEIEAKGTLSDVNLDKLYAGMLGVFYLKAKGTARNPLDINRLVADVSFDGSLSDPSLVDKFLAPSDFGIPAFTIKGAAEARGNTYGADFTLLSDAGDIAAKGKVALTPETYTFDINTTGLDVGRFVPSIGVGRVTASIRAKGAGFNPLSGTAVTDAIVDIASIEYNRRELRGIHLAANLSNAGDLILDATSANPGLDLDISGSGSIHPDDYVFDVSARIRDLDLQALGLSDSICSGHADFDISGSASPGKWIYDVDLTASDIDWNLPAQTINLPEGVSAKVRTDAVSTAVQLNSLLTYIDFSSSTGLESLIKGFTTAADVASRQISAKNLDVSEISNCLPGFNLRLNASGNGLLSQFLYPSGMALDTIWGDIGKDSIFTANVEGLNFRSSTIDIDTLTFNLRERGTLLDYIAHVGNRPGTLDEFAQVNLRGYVGTNRASAFLTQQNIKGEQGYRIGLTAAVEDSVITAHITPLNSTIAYLPWSFNADNYVDYNLHNMHINANLQANSSESSVMIKTQPNEAGNEELALKIDNLHIEDFLRMWALAPPMKGALNADLHLTYLNNRFEGKGNVGMKGFTYDKLSVGDFDLSLDAGYGGSATTDVNASLLINGDPAMTAYASLRQSTEGFVPDSLGVSLTRFPLKIANPFLGQSVVLSGYLNGDMRMDGSFASPVLNGEISFDSVAARIPMMASDLKFGQDPLKVTDNVVSLEDFFIYGANENPLELSGTVNAKKFSNIIFDLQANASNFQLLKTDKRSRGDLYGKIFLNLGATVKGPMNLLDINGDVRLLGTTDATYRLNMESSGVTTATAEDVVKFVNFNDTTNVAAADSAEQSPFNMRINAGVQISPGTQLEVILSSNGTDKVEFTPTANLSYTQNFMGDMNLSGTLTLGDGFVRYSFPVIGEKMFTFNPSSTVTWRGDVANPTLNITATDEVKANVTSGNNSRLVNFLVTLDATNTVNNLKVAFDLSTNDDLTIQNELQSMSADQRQTQAMNLLLYGQYTGQNTKASAASGNYLYSFLESQLNSWAAKNIRGVDLTFGVNQYDKTSEGVTNTETSYSYKVSKSLFNNRFKIQMGGNYSTDTEDSDIAENLVSDVSLEYILKQTTTTDMSVRLFRHIGYESILEGEITEMGVGFVMKRRLENLKSLFNFLRRRKRKKAAGPDSVHQTATLRKDTVETTK